MAEIIYYIPIRKTCSICYGDGEIHAAMNYDIAVKCPHCEGKGMVEVLMPLDEFALEIDLSEEAAHNLMCSVRDL